MCGGGGGGGGGGGHCHVGGMPYRNQDCSKLVQTNLIHFQRTNRTVHQIFSRGHWWWDIGSPPPK